MTILVQQLRAEIERLQAENEVFEEGCRKLAFQLSAGGYNAAELTAEKLIAKVQGGLDLFCESTSSWVQKVEAERDRLKVDVDALLCDCPDYADVERLCHVLSYLGYSTPTGGEASARWLSLVKELIGAVETSELLRRDKESVAEYRQLKAENAELRRDAERYRWLRDSAPSRLAAGPVIAMAEADGSVLARDDGHEMLLGREDADAAIDQAMTKEQP